MKEKLIKLLDVKTVVTLGLTLVFGILVLFSKPIPALFEEIYRLVIVFYFGTQVQKLEDYLKALERKEGVE